MRRRAQSATRSRSCWRRTSRLPSPRVCPHSHRAILSRGQLCTAAWLRRSRRSRLAACIRLTKELDGITVLVPDTNTDLTNCAPAPSKTAAPPAPAVSARLPETPCGTASLRRPRPSLPRVPVRSLPVAHHPPPPFLTRAKAARGGACLASPAPLRRAAMHARGHGRRLSIATARVPTDLPQRRGARRSVSAFRSPFCPLPLPLLPRPCSLSCSAGGECMRYDAPFK